jgi:hypothetical protein
MKDHYEVHFKNANYLLLAHAAGLVGCITVLKDYAATPQLKGMGTFVVLFGVGLLASIFTYIALVLAPAVALGPYQRASDELTRNFFELGSSWLGRNRSPYACWRDYWSHRHVSHRCDEAESSLFLRLAIIDRINAVRTSDV